LRNDERAPRAFSQAVMQDHRFTQQEDAAKGRLPPPSKVNFHEPVVDRLAAFRGLLVGLGLAVVFWMLVAAAVIAWLHHT